MDDHQRKGTQVNVKDKRTNKTYLVVLDSPQGYVVKDADNITFALLKTDVVIVPDTSNLDRVGS